MRIAGQEIEVYTDTHHGGWMSTAYLPDGKQVHSAPWDTREGAEHDVYQQALLRLRPTPMFDPTKTYERAVVSRLADRLLEHCGHCPEDSDEPMENPPCPMCSGPGVPLGTLGRRKHFRCQDCGYDFSEDPPPVSEAALKCECSDPLCPACHGHCTKAPVTNLVRTDMDDQTGTLFCRACAADAFDSGLFRDDRGAYIRATTRATRAPRSARPNRYIPPPKASFYPGSGGSAGIGGVTGG